MIHERHKDWLQDRGIDPALAERFGLTTTNDSGGYWLTVPYREAGVTLNHKYRQTRDKGHRMDGGAPLTFWNVDCLRSEPVLRGDAPVVITEGEWDALAAAQAGFEHVMSVPNGAPATATSGPVDPENDAVRFAYVWRAKADLDAVKCFVLAVDSDEPGRVLAFELARRLGPERCRFVTYPTDCKDLNDVLIAEGVGGVSRVLNAAKPYPIKGLFRMSDFPDPPPVKSIPLDIPGATEAPELVPGTLTVWTGFAGMGKTSLMMFLVANLMRRGVNVAMGSFETQVKPILQRKLRAALLGEYENRLTWARLPEADAVIEERFTLMCQDIADENHELTLEEVLELARVAVIRDGAAVVIIDPWNELEHRRRADESETEYTGRAIRAFKAFAKLYGVAVWIVAHPKKPMQWGQKPVAPGLYDISGSAHWANKADYGAVVHRPNKETNMTHLVFCKVRMGLPGREQTVKLEWQWTDSRFVAAINEMADAA